jgi:hypothetical protein
MYYKIQYTTSQYMDQLGNNSKLGMNLYIVTFPVQGLKSEVVTINKRI